MTAQNAMTLTGTRIVAGVWEGILTGAGAEAPGLEVTHLGRALAGVQVGAADNASFLVRVPIPAELLHDGVQTFLISAQGRTLAHFTVITGVAMEDDLRAELDMLKRAFRRHCVETAG